jgi:site-specific DNA recombinase
MVLPHKTGSWSICSPKPALRDAVLASPERTITDIAGSIGQCRSRLGRLLRISWLAPEIVESILAGRQPAGLTPRKLLTAQLPLGWDAQKSALEFS